MGATDEYVALAEQFPGRLPVLDQNWHTIPTQIGLPDQTFATKLVDIMAADTPALLIILEPKASK